MNFDQIVEKIRTERNFRDEVPSFDPSNGNEQAKILFLLEAPGPKAVQSGVISIDNNDPTAARMKSQLLEANICKSDIAIWNIVPWYIGKESEVKTIRAAVSSDIAEGNEYLPLVISAMSELQCVVLVGGAARKAHVVLSAMTTARILSCHHTSARSMNLNPSFHEENVRVFKYIKSTIT